MPLRSLCTLGALALSSGCGTAGQGTQEPALEVASEYGRHAAVQGKVDLYVTNRGADPLEVESFQVVHPMFELIAAVEREALLPATGEQTVVPVSFGRPLCNVTVPTGAQVVLGVRRGDRVEDVRLPLADREPGLLRAHRLACAAELVESVVALELRTEGSRVQTPRGQVLRMSLRLSRRNPGRVEVTELSGNILFTVRTDRLVLAPGADTAAGELLVRASRCDRHALTESKTSFTFPLLASVDGAPPARLTVTATGAARDALQALLDDTCEVA